MWIWTLDGSLLNLAHVVSIWWCRDQGPWGGTIYAKVVNEPDGSRKLYSFCSSGQRERVMLNLAEKLKIVRLNDTFEEEVDNEID